LEADLAAAEINEDAGDVVEDVPEDIVEALEEAAPEIGDDFDDGFEPDFDEEPASHPPPRADRGDRGDRGERRDRGRRDDRRGGPRRDTRGPHRRMGGRPGMGRPKPLIQDIFKRGQEVLVQVIKEGIGTKGPTLSTYISIPGRYLVLMPGLNRTGVSRKIVDEEHRRRLREIFNELKPPRGLGFIMRTAAIDKNKKDIQRDLAYLSRLWQVIVRRIRKVKSPAEIYQESDMITRTIRDTFTGDIDTIWVDETAAFEHAQEFLQVVMPRYASRIKLYDAKEPLFHKYGIEDEINRIQMRKVPLPHGGSIVIEQTEALVAIDVNSGNFRADNNAEETAYQMNLHAAKEIARQLRLRDLGGVIVNDFIDMRDEKHRRAVEKAMRDAVKRDRARTKILKISQFGLIEMTRQRIRPSLKRSVYQDCPYCHGMAQVKTSESMSIEVMRMLQLVAHRENVQRIEIHVTDEVANYLLNKKRREISKLEESGNIQVQINGSPGKPPEMLEFVCYDKNNNEVKALPVEEPPTRRSR
jgi:ribonuclease E